MHFFKYNIFTGKLERIPNKWINQSQCWKTSGELIHYDLIESEDGSIFVDIVEEPIVLGTHKSLNNIRGFF
jgi:hypothetical protein